MKGEIRWGSEDPREPTGGQVPEQMSALSEAMGELSETAMFLCNQLITVCSDYHEPKKENEVSPPQELCRLADQIRGERSIAKRVTEELRCAINTLQL